MSTPAPGKSLQHLRADLALLWDAERNTLTPSEVGLGSAYLAWWKCSEGHQWQTKVSSRVHSKNSCPECVRPKRRVSDLDPTLVAQWDTSRNQLSVNEVFTGGREKYWWTCEQEHHWQATVYSRISGRGCPYCSGRMAVAGTNDLLSAYPEIAALWHPTRNTMSPSEITSKSRRKFWWQCDQGHEWQASMDRGRLAECPTCKQDRKSLLFTHPLLCDQWDHQKNSTLPEFFTQGMNEKVHWVCNQGHQWQACISDRAIYGTGCPRCAILGTGSSGERQLRDFIHSLGFHPEVNNRSLIHPYELDLYLPDLKIAFEYNGLYWHSEAGGKDKWYHFNKYDLCKQQGVRLLQVWEDDWLMRRSVVESMIRHILGVSDLQSIHARKTHVVKVSAQAAHDFFEHNHILGKVVGCQYLGLEHDNKLVACVALRQRNDHAIYVERYATSAVVRGGFTKLLSQLKQRYSVDEVITFADLSLSEGSLYTKTGFVFDGFVEPDYSYLVHQRRVHKFNYRLKRFEEDEDLLFEEGKTEAQLAQLNGLRRIWDSGKNRYRFSL